MKFEHMYAVLKICEQQRFHLVALRYILSGVEVQHHIHVHSIAHQMDVIIILNVSAAFLLRISLFFCQSQQALSIDIFLNGLWLLYFAANGMFLLSSFEDSLLLNLTNLILLILDVFGSNNISQCFNTLLYAFGFFAYANFFQNFPEWELPGGVLCFLLIFIDKVRTYDSSNGCLAYLSIQIISLVCIPILGNFILDLQKDIYVVLAWLGLLGGMSFCETYMYFLKDNPPEVEPIEVLEMV